MSRIPEDRPLDAVDETARDKLEQEYLRHVLVPHTHFAVDHSVNHVREDGTLEQRDERAFFNVISVSGGRTREHTMHTAQTRDEIQHGAAFSIEVQMLDRWVQPQQEGEDAAEDDGKLRVFAESDPIWTLQNRIAKFEDFASRLFRYRRVVPEPDHPAIVVLYDEEKGEVFGDSDRPEDTHGAIGHCSAT